MDVSKAVEEGPSGFGSFELYPRLREIRRGSTRIRLQQQPFDILCMMLDRPGELLARDDIRLKLWPEGTFVDFEHSLNAAIKRLRSALGDSAHNPRFIETLSRRGYRFIGALADEQKGPPTLPSCARLAVLPFSNLSPDPAQDVFCDGLTEDVITQIGQRFRGRVDVVARRSIMAFKGSTDRVSQIGEHLQTDYLLEGSVRRDDERLRMTARLVDALTETHLWAEAYERPLTDPLSAQYETASLIAASLLLEAATWLTVPAPRAMGQVRAQRSLERFETGMLRIDPHGGATRLQQLAPTRVDFVDHSARRQNR
ncbi:MAG: hypothetical protein A3H29_00200 [Acidobacteria bacterium RIFCSPLOWO2_02_FULL_67_21]|nr:MAG: hypothetical protein A3H29_00200 [Acidobacteria bacterium RIFCSPLOWO2_02_FULL_67_21]